MRIDGLAIDSGPDVYYEEGFRITLEDHMTYLRTHPNTKTMQIDSFKAYKYASDLFGLLAEYSLPTELNWVIMRMNNMTSPTQCSESLKSLLLPDAQVVERMRSLYMTQNKISH